jgi:hypothetical protein
VTIPVILSLDARKARDLRMSRVPRLLSGHNLASLSLTQAESFLVSQIDAVLSETDLAFVSGLSPQQVAAMLDRLARAGVVDFPHEPKPQPSRPPARAPSAPSHTPPRRPQGAPYDPAELDEQVDLDVEKKKRILDLYYRLDDLTYYQLLNVATDVEKKQVKSAYYALAPEFHPDKHFRKNLGSFKAKIEAVFGRITLAHDTLANAQRRKEYDEYLATTASNRAMSAALEQPGDELAIIEAALKQAAAAAVAKNAAPAAPANGARVAPVVPSAPPVSADEALRLRREALARKLTGGRRTAPNPAALRATPPVRPPEMDPEIAARAAEALRVRHEAAVADAKRQQVHRYIDAGKAAMERNDFAAGANAFRIAASLEPDDEKVQAVCKEAMQRAAVALADGYRKQAAYEEGQERWAEAALSYSKVCSGSPDDAHAHERVAYATLRSSNNVRRAVEFARRAVELAPKSPEFRVTLARAYAAAGLGKSCHGELDRALTLAQGNARVQAMVAQARALAPKDGKLS